MQTILEVRLDPGAVVAGKYRIERVLGQGGMGIVASAIHLQLEQRVALKLMLPLVAANRDAVARFLREARAAARITSEHVARVFDVGALETGEPYIAMEYLEGGDVAQLLAGSGSLAPTDAVDFILQASVALAEAHMAGIVHRDLKPANLYLSRRPDGQRLIKVLDFGISKVTGGELKPGDLATRTSALMGSPLYMSPEQMSSSKEVDARSDIWALGVVLYEMLSGSPPFNGENLPQVCARVMTEEAPPLAARAPGLPAQVYAAVHRCLQREPSARFQSVAELAQALGPFGSAPAYGWVERICRLQNVAFGSATSASSMAGPLGATPTLLSSHQTSAIPALTPAGRVETYAPFSETKPPPVQRRSIAWVMLLGVALVGGGAAWFAFGRAAAVPTSAGTASASPEPPPSVPTSSSSAPSNAPTSSAELAPPPRVEATATVSAAPSVTAQPFKPPVVAGRLPPKLVLTPSATTSPVVAPPPPSASSAPPKRSRI